MKSNKMYNCAVCETMALDMKDLVPKLNTRLRAGNFDIAGSIYWILCEDISQLRKRDTRLPFQRYRFKGHIFKIVNNTLHVRCYLYCTGQCESAFRYEKVNNSAKQFDEIIKFIESVKR